MSIELEGVPSPAVNSSPVNTPASGPVAGTAVDHNGFTAEDRTAAQNIFNSTADPVDVLPRAAAPNVQSGAANAAPAGEQASSVDPELRSLAAAFGADFTGVNTNDAASAALAPILEVIARAGLEVGNDPIAPAAPVAPAVPANQTVPSPAPDFSLSEAELSELTPELAGIFKHLGTKQSALLKSVLEQAQAATAAANDVKKQWDDQKATKLQGVQNEISHRASLAVEALNSAKYGTVGKRSVVQQIEFDNVSRVAGAIINGLVRYGAPVPTIEQVIRAAVLKYEGKLPSAPAAVAPAPIVPLAPRQAQGRAVSSRSGVGSTTAGGDSLMGDADYLAAARAILS